MWLFTKHKHDNCTDEKLMKFHAHGHQQQSLHQCYNAWVLMFYTRDGINNALSIKAVLPITDLLCMYQ